MFAIRVLATVLLAVAVGSFTLFAWELLGFDWKQNPQALTIILGALATFSAALLSALVSFSVAKNQAINARELEDIKSRLGRLSVREDAAYHAMWKAIATSYRAVSKLETGTFEAEEALNTLPKLFHEAEAEILVVAPKHEQLFFEYWQAIEELLSEVRAKCPDSSASRLLWSQHAEPLAQKWAGIKEELSQALRGRSDLAVGPQCPWWAHLWQNLRATVLVLLRPRTSPIAEQGDQADPTAEVHMRTDLQRHSVALALLAVLVGAIVQITQGTGPFTPWQTIVGLIMLFTARTYDSEIDARLGSEAVAFAMIVAAGMLFVFGFTLDRLFLTVQVVGWDQNREKLLSLPGYISFSLHDDAYFAIWLTATAVVVWLRSLREKP